ncbi:GntR family transcriptional regulator [Nocardia alni]|uniref:GntR family transcriptional regulator n=1 Tax=Nocardia alni TaxID=2815723 RepID=UPI0020B4002A|nr:GntR family transcriptional regulator [Nocardia alni]
MSALSRRDRAGRIEDGRRINQVQPAERYGVSRIPVREALRRLQSESLVVLPVAHAPVAIGLPVGAIRRWRAYSSGDQR